MRVGDYIGSSAKRVAGTPQRDYLAEPFGAGRWGAVAPRARAFTVRDRPHPSRRSDREPADPSLLWVGAEVACREELATWRDTKPRPSARLARWFLRRNWRAHLDTADDRYVEQHCGGDSEAHLLELHELAAGEARHDDYDNLLPAPEMIRAVGAIPVSTASHIEPPQFAAFLHAADHEDLVVRQEPKSIERPNSASNRNSGIDDGARRARADARSRVRPS